jgi:hypothetical protein
MCDTPGLSAAAGIIGGGAGGGLGLHLGLSLPATVAVAALLALVGEGLIHARYGWPDGSCGPTTAACRRLCRAVGR